MKKRKATSTFYDLESHNFRERSQRVELEVIRREVSVSPLTLKFGVNFS